MKKKSTVFFCNFSNIIRLFFFSFAFLFFIELFLSLCILKTLTLTWSIIDWDVVGSALEDNVIEEIWFRQDLINLLINETFLLITQ